MFACVSFSLLFRIGDIVILSASGVGNAITMKALHRTNVYQKKVNTSNSHGALWKIIYSIQFGNFGK